MRETLKRGAERTFTFLNVLILVCMAGVWTQNADLRKRLTASEQFNKEKHGMSEHDREEIHSMLEANRKRISALEKARKNGERD